MASPVETRSAHTVSSWVKARLKSGMFKKCGHLVVLPVNMPPTMRRPSRLTRFIPNCNRNSFDWKAPEFDFDDRLERRLHGLDQDPISCPKDCLYYEPRGWTKTKKLVRKIFSGIGSWFKWFLGLHWAVQVSILLLMTSAIAPHWIPPLIDLLKALKSLFNLG